MSGPDRTRRNLFAVVLMLCGFGSGGRAAPDVDAALETCLAEAIDRDDFSGAALIARNGAVAAAARGLAMPAGAATTTATRFNLGSASKMFTAVAVGQLVERGAIRLDDPIGRHVDGLTPEASAVTIRQLLTHSSGLGNFFTPDNLPQIAKSRRLEELKALIANDRPAFPPGRQFAYSNSGFLLLGLMIERVSRQSFGDYLRTHVFAPAGMASTGLDPGPDGQRAVGLTTGPVGGSGGPGGPRLGPPPGGQAGPPPGLGGPLGDGPPPAATGPLRSAPEAALPGTPAGGAFSTVGDLRLFFAALRAGKLLKPPTLAQWTSRQIVSGPARGDLPELGYGYGFGTSGFAGHRWYGHNGGAPGLNAEAIAFPEDDIVIAVLANRDPPAASELMRRLREKVLRGGC